MGQNNSFGFAASVRTLNTANGIKYSHAIAGFVWINEHLIISPELPLGGFKASGFSKNNLAYGFNEYTQLKMV